MTGGGEVHSVRVTGRALRELDNHSLAAQVLTAVNDGLDRAEELVADAAGGPQDKTAEEALSAFERRMDDLLYELDVIDRRLGHFDD